MAHLIQASVITDFHRESIVKWKLFGEPILTQENFLALVEQNHAFNYRLWHAEDRARRDDKGYEFVYQAKREIDHFNQQRNNYMEKMDTWIFNALQPEPATQCTVHSETPGMIIDRLSILALKAYHMELQTKRQEVSPTHREDCLAKFNRIIAQQDQLTECLDQFLQEIVAKTRTFKMYHQFKMYNDPALNPELYTTTSN